MKIIYKKISLSPFKSRINGSLTSYHNYDNFEEFPNYSENSKIHNYGMFPFDVKYKDLTLSYPTLMERYHFCKKYKEMLKYNNCNNEYDYYDNSLEYYKHEVSNKSNDEQKIYEDMDKLFDEYGGNDFYKWCNNILKNSNFNDYSDKFNDNIKNTAHINIPILFTNTIDDLGEFSIFSNEWEAGENYQTELSYGTTVIYDDEVWQFKPNKDIENDYGSIYSKKYKESYFPQISDLTTNPDYQWYQKSKEKNAIENGEKQWINYTDYYFNNGEGNTLYSNNYCENNTNSETTYANKDGKIIYCPTPNDMSYNYEIIKNKHGYFLINDTLYDIINIEYVEYVNNDILFVHTIEQPNYNVKYCTYNELKFYSKTDDNDVTKHYFEFYDENGEKIRKNVNNDGYFINYQGKPHKVNDDNETLTIIKDDLSITYYKLDGYCIIDGQTFYVKGTDIVTPNRKDIENDKIGYILDNSLSTTIGKKISQNEQLNNTSSGYTVSDNTINVFKPYVEYSLSKISGYTESKLNSFMSYNTITDDVGNILPGLIQKNEDGTYNQIKENDVLDLPYQVGNINNLSVFEEDTNGEPNKWFGNILTSITFYYEDYYGNMIMETETKCGYGESLLSGITQCKDTLETYMKKDNEISKNHNSINETMKCKFIYHMGAIITCDETQYKVSTDEYEQGVIYEDIVSIQEKQTMYYYDEFSAIPIKYYDFDYNTKYITMNEYSNATIEVNQSKYWFKIDDLINNKNNENEAKNNNSRALYDGLIAASVFREEYKLGIAMKENIENDIYIDRGVSNAFEKHLNLLNVNSFESLEQFGNNFFNIIES